jgi:hypothetical protein
MDSIRPVQVGAAIQVQEKTALTVGSLVDYYKITALIP